MKREEALEKVDGALAELEQALANGDSETLKNYLKFLSCFHNFRGYSGDPAENLQTLEQFATDKNITVLWQRPDSGALGVSKGGLIEVDPDLEAADRFAVLVHEVSHELLHRGERREKTDKIIRETEAEAVAFAVCSAVGLEVGNSAADYIKLWQGDVIKLRESLDFIRVTASEILSALSTDVPVEEPVPA